MRGRVEVQLWTRAISEAVWVKSSWAFVVNFGVGMSFMGPDCQAYLGGEGRGVVSTGIVVVVVVVDIVVDD